MPYPQYHARRAHRLASKPVGKRIPVVDPIAAVFSAADKLFVASDQFLIEAERAMRKQKRPFWSRIFCR